MTGADKRQTVGERRASTHHHHKMALSRTLTLYLAVAAAAALPAASAFCAAPLPLRASRTPAARSMTMGAVPIVIPTASSSAAKIPRVLHAETPGFAASAYAPTGHSAGKGMSWNEYRVCAGESATVSGWRQVRFAAEPKEDASGAARQWRPVPHSMVSLGFMVV